MRKLVADYLKLMDMLYVITRKALLVITGAMTALVILQVICRYVLKYPLVWTEEVARYLMLWMAFTSASCVIKRWDNIYVDFFINILKQKPRRFIILFQKFVVLGLLIYSFCLCITVFPKIGACQTFATLNISMLWAQSSMIVGFLLAALQNIGVILNDLYKDDKYSEEGAQC
jgi:TRAP-type C4-dicarboxylate transport system permease small subunit